MHEKGNAGWLASRVTLPAASNPLSMTPMLEIRPTCENCDTSLPPSSTAARICSFECTFCASCVDTVLENVCPNCGGGFAPRPIRPATNWQNGNHLGAYPASSAVKHHPVERQAHVMLVARLKDVPPGKR